MVAFPSNKSCPRCKGEMQYICLTSYPPQYKARCLYCGYEEGNTIQKQTNADRIRAMTDDELADFLDDIIHDWGEGSAYLRARGMWVDNWDDWLKQEVSE